MRSTELNQGPIIDVTIILDERQIPQFIYTENGQQVTGSVVVTQGQDITYQLLNSPGYKFLGAGFITPFNHVVDSVQLSADGQQLTLIDEDSVPGSSKFQLILSDTTNSLWLISPDPQVVNRKEEEA